ncbi:MAG: ABC transporter permease [Bacillota bacterium]|jgi:ABC-2 type transport system permease protein
MFTEDRKGVAALARYVSFVWEYMKVNMAMEMEYRAAFLARMFGMIVNDCMWLCFWVMYFTRFPVVQGWTKNDVITLWAICGIGYGLAAGIFGNALRLAGIISSGNLDFYLSYPKNVLIHALCSRVDVSGLGDVLFGPLVFILLARPSLHATVLFLVSGILVACIFTGFSVLAGSLAFFIGNSENVAAQVFNSLIHFSTYPSVIFHGTIKVVLFTLIPAGFINSVPVKVVRDFDPLFFLGLICASIFFLSAANYVFNLGLRRYESGNLVQARM